MRLRRFHLWTVTWLLLAAGVLVLWSNSYFEMVEVVYARPGGFTEYRLRSYFGSLRLDTRPWGAYHEGLREVHWVSVHPSERRHFERFIPTIRPLIVPYWVVFLAVLLIAVIPWAWRARRRRRARQRCLCEACGYDLRASPDRCPECGMAAIGTRTHAMTQLGPLLSIVPVVSWR
jgi:hypothetical protein